MSLHDLQVEDSGFTFLVKIKELRTVEKLDYNIDYGHSNIGFLG